MVAKSFTNSEKAATLVSKLQKENKHLMIANSEGVVRIHFTREGR